MKILHTVELYHPSVGGMQEVVKQLSERLVKMGHNVTVATRYHPERKGIVLNGVKIEQFKISGNAVHGFQGDKKEIERYKKFLIGHNFDIITNFAAQQWATDLALPILDKIKAKKVFVPTGFSGLYIKGYRKYFQKMKFWMKQYDINVFLSRDYRDINFAKKNGVKKRILIPNGASEEEFLSKNEIDIRIRKRLQIPENHFLVLLVGSHTGTKGHKEAINIFKKARIKNATFLIIGRRGNNLGEGCRRYCWFQEKLFKLSPKRLFDKKKLIITTLPRSEIISAYKEADLFLFPSNIECSPLVLFECMASKTPYLTTDAGNSAEIIKWSQSGILLPTIKDSNGYSRADIEGSVSAFEDLYSNPLKREKMKEAGFEVWKEKFTWGRIARDYEKLYESLVKGG